MTQHLNYSPYPATLWCPRCAQVKPFEAFYGLGTPLPCGRRHRRVCKACSTEQNQEQYEKRKVHERCMKPAEVITESVAAPTAAKPEWLRKLERRGSVGQPQQPVNERTGLPLIPF
jgi:hypothetical protein